MTETNVFTNSADRHAMQHVGWLLGTCEQRGLFAGGCFRRGVGGWVNWPSDWYENGAGREGITVVYLVSLWC